MWILYFFWYLDTFTTINAKSLKRSQNGFQWTTKHVFWQDYFLHMWPARKARHFEHNFFVKWLRYWVFFFVTLFFKISRLWKFCMIWFSIKFIQWTCTFIKGAWFLLYNKIEINCMTLCIPFDSSIKNVI